MNIDISQKQAAILAESAGLAPSTSEDGDSAEDLYQEALEIVKQELGLEHPRTLVLKVLRPLSCLCVPFAGSDSQVKT